MKLLFLFMMIFLVVGMMLFITLNKIHIKTSTMAVVMAFGIVTRGVLLNYFGMAFFRGNFGKLLCIFIFSLWLAIILAFIIQYLDGKFKEIHFVNQMNRFGVGTWVAGTSICGILFYKQFSQYDFLPETITIVNIFLWMIYIVMSGKTLADIFQAKISRNVHGILLLTTVSTQSIVLLMNTVFKQVPIYVNLLFILIGFCFYIICVLFIFKRYFTDSWTIEEDWNNTNCIIHGALSISGIACIVSGIVNFHIISFIWGVAFIMFIIVESIEIYRLIRRLKSLGLKKGIFIYDVTQWSRVFTFAMFYTFTFRMKDHLLFVSFIKNVILTTGVWVVLIIVTFEFLLNLTAVFNDFQKASRKVRQEKDITSSF